MRQDRDQRGADLCGPLAGCDAEVVHRRARERERVSPKACDGGGCEDAGGRMGRVTNGTAGRLHREREQRQTAERRQQRPGAEGKSGTGVAP